MDEETRAAFARMDRYFELAQAQHAELRAEVQSQFGRLDTRLAGVEDRLAALEASFRSFRDWVSEQFAGLRAGIQQLTVRIETLERRQVR